MKIEEMVAQSIERGAPIRAQRQQVVQEHVSNVQEIAANRHYTFDLDGVNYTAWRYTYDAFSGARWYGFRLTSAGIRAPYIANHGGDFQNALTEFVNARVAG